MATTMPQASRAHRVEPWLRVGLFSVGVFAIVELVRAADLARVTELVRHAGWPLALVLVPTGLAMAVDAEGWRLILGALGHRVGWWALLRARLAVESIVLAMPGGPVAGEAVKVGMLSWRAGIPPAAGTASLAITKACLWGSESVYLLIASAAVAFGSFSQAPGRVLLLTVGGAVLVATLSAAAFALLRGGSAASQIGRLLERVPIDRFRSWIEARRSSLATLDESARSFFLAPRHVRVRALATFTIEWLVEGLETLLILRCIGVAIGVGDAIALDGVTSLLRAMAFFVPAGLGVQDVTQLLLLRQLGVPDATATAGALIFIKRTKEVFWVFTGSLFFTGSKGP
jgi:uncharacterized membrane protein YbhN (UPF0104 family)